MSVLIIMNESEKKRVLKFTRYHMTFDFCLIITLFKEKLTDDSMKDDALC